MLGNDVVDLELAQHQIRWETKAFQQKVLHPLEIKKYKDKVLGFTDFWKIWSCKEVAYKAHQRKFNLKPRLNPFDFSVSETSTSRSEVKIDNYKYEVASFINPNFIYSIIHTPEAVSSQNFEISSYNSYFKKDLNRNCLNHMLHKDKNGIPYIKINSSFKPISITHHGKYVAFQFQDKTDLNFLWNADILKS